MKFKSQAELVKENCGGMEKLGNPANFSSNPGFMSTAGMLHAAAPGSVIRGSSARGSLQRPPSPARAISPASAR